MSRATLFLCTCFLVLVSTEVPPRHVKAYSLSALSASVAPQEGERSRGEGREEIYHWINFLLLVGALVYLGRKPLREFFAQRSAAVRKELDEGRKALEASQAQLSAVEEKLRHLEEQIAAFKASAVREMEAECLRLREAAAAEAEKIRESARAQIDLALRSAKLELRVQAAQQAVELAEEMVRQRLDDAGRSRLFSRFIAGLDAKEKKN